jgi:hypothetical protein
MTVIVIKPYRLGFNDNYEVGWDDEETPTQQAIPCNQPVGVPKVTPTYGLVGWDDVGIPTQQAIPRNQPVGVTKL